MNDPKDLSFNPSFLLDGLGIRLQRFVIIIYALFQS